MQYIPILREVQLRRLRFLCSLRKAERMAWLCGDADAEATLRRLVAERWGPRRRPAKTEPVRDLEGASR